MNTFHTKSSLHNKMATGTPRVHLRLVSDLHLETRRAADEVTFGLQGSDNVDILCIAGDLAPIGHLRASAYLREACRRYPIVCYVAGNHEFYEQRSPKTAGIATLRQRFQALPETLDLPNLLCLDNSFHDLVDVKIRLIGTTLWSHIPLEAAAAVAARINDYRCIFTEHADQKMRKITPVDVNGWHAEARQFLDGAFHLDPAWHNVVMTHHAPFIEGASAPQYAGHVTNHAFCTDLTADLLPRATVWLSGHTHHQYCHTIGGTLVANCPLGYVREDTGTLWSGRIVIGEKGAEDVE